MNEKNQGHYNLLDALELLLQGLSNNEKYKINTRRLKSGNTETFYY